jgi:hypothetical protein
MNANEYKREMFDQYLRTLSYIGYIKFLRLTSLSHACKWVAISRTWCSTSGLVG